MADGIGTCPYRGTECLRANCTHFDSEASICIISQGTKTANELLKDIKKILKDILAK
jgi:predicted site-specific integrase-resolvase